MLRLSDDLIISQTRESGNVMDVMHYEICGRGKFGGTWVEAENYYRDILRDPDNINFVTVLREPRSHLIRYTMMTFCRSDLDEKKIDAYTLYFT